MPEDASPVDVALVQRACDALLAHVRAHAAKRKDKTLPMGDDDDELHLTFGLSVYPESALKTFKGHALTLPHPYRGQSDVCLLVKDKDEAKTWLGDDYKKVVQVRLGAGREGRVAVVGFVHVRLTLPAPHGRQFKQKIISLQQLRTQYKTFESRRELAARYDVFVSDDRIVCMLCVFVHVGKD